MICLPLTPMLLCRWSCFLGIVLNVVSHVSRTATDFFLKSLTLVVQLAFQATATSTATANALHEDVLAQIPTTLDAALARFNLSTRTITYTVCPACHCVYAPTLCPESRPTYLNTCSNRSTPESGTCGASLTEPGSSKLICPYVVHDFDDYVSGLMSQKDNVRYMIAACDDTMNAIEREQPSVEEITTPFQVEFVRSFMFEDGTQFSDRKGKICLLFTFHVDSFNVEGMSVQGASMSCCIISAACLNLPAEIWYKVENMYLGAFIPSPNKPQLTELNHYLEPVVNMFVKLWKHGICHSRTALHPKGCVSCSAIAAAVMDLVVACKAAQLTSHSSHHYCHVCACYHLSTRGWCGYMDWTFCDITDMRQHAEMWRDATSSGKCTKIFQMHGVRWLVMWNLPYWNPT